MSWPDFWNAILPPFAAGLAMVFTALCWTAVAYLKSVRDTLEEKGHRETLDSALRTGMLAELKVNPTASDKELAVAGSKWAVGKGAADAVRAFDLGGADLGRKAMSIVPEVRTRLAESKQPC